MSHLASIDLNLLVVLRELIRERNVTRAATRLGVTQPAVSAALTRLRRHFDDELLVRSGNRYSLSALAAELADQVEVVCAAAERLLSTGREFDPATSNREFTILMADYAAAVVGKPLSMLLAAEAPGVSLHIRLVTEAFSREFAKTIRLIDGLIAPPISQFELANVFSMELFTDRWVCIVDARNKYADVESLTLGQLADMHWIVPFQPHRGIPAVAPLTRLLARSGIQPEVRTRVESYQVVPHLVAGTDRVALVQERLALQVADRLGVRVLPCSDDLDPITECFWWYGDADRDAGHQWFRDILRRAALTI